MPPGRLGKQGAKFTRRLVSSKGSVRIVKPLLVKWLASLRCFRLLFKEQKWIKLSLEKAVRANSLYAPASYMYLKVGKCEEAITELEKAVKRNFPQCSPVVVFG
jgi:hypothetical protein